MKRGRARLVGLLLAGAMLGGACSNGSTPEDKGSATTVPTSTAPDPGTADQPLPPPDPEQQGMDQVGALLDEEGRLSKEQALALWAARITPLDGVTALPRDEVADVGMDLIKVRVAAWLPELPADQQAIAQTVLDGQDQVELEVDGSDPGPATTTVGTAALAPVIAEPVSLTAAMVSDEELRMAAVETQARFKRLFGSLTLPLRFSTSSMRVPDPERCAEGALPGSAECPWAFDDTGTGATTYPVLGSGGELIACRVVMNRDVLLPADGAEARRGRRPRGSRPDSLDREASGRWLDSRTMMLHKRQSVVAFPSEERCMSPLPGPLAHSTRG